MVTPTKTGLPPAKTATGPVPWKTKEAGSAPAAEPDRSAEAIKKVEKLEKTNEKLEERTNAVNANNVARVANSQLVSADDKLSPLVSLKTNGGKIDRFPATPRDIGKLSVTLLDTMLVALEADRTGTEDVKRERLRVQIGLKPNPA